MAISEPKFATEFVTKKGKVYKFDSIECLIHFMRTNDIERNSLSHLLVNHYLKPNGFLDADKAFFLKSENLPSPMGEGLSAFSSSEEMQQMQKQYTGQYYTWSQLMEIIK
jgi:copper chaperone NosL